MVGSYISSQYGQIQLVLSNYNKFRKSQTSCKMGNLLSQGQKLYIYKWTAMKTDDIFVKLHDLSSAPHPLNGKILIPFTQVHDRQEFIRNYHHKVILINDLHQLRPFVFFKFRGLPIIKEEQLAKQPQNCLKMHFNCKNCPIPIILERFNENLLCSYINAFHVYGINVHYYDNLQIFLRAECPIPLIICSNIELEQLSHRIQSLSYRNEKQEKLTILCFCNKDQYTFPKKTQLIMQSANIEVVLFHNMLEIIQKLKKDSLRSPYNIPQKSEKILFYLDSKQKQVNYLSKMARRIEKSIRYLKVEKIANKNQLIQQIKASEHSIVVIGKDSKEMRNYIDIEQHLEEQGLEDRVIFLRRDAQLNDRLLQKIENLTIQPNYVSQSLIQKHIVFYGTLDYFKNAIKYFPKLSFKKYIDSSQDKQSIKFFLSISTEVVMTHHRICECVQKWKNQIKCKVILVKHRQNTQKIQKLQPKGCDKQRWYSKQDQLLQAFQQSSEHLYGVNFNFKSKKMAYISGIISEIFTKFKQKKNILHNDLFGTIFLFSCEYYYFDQISNYIVKYFSSKTLGIFDKPCQFQHLKFRLYQELLQLQKSIRIQEDAIYHLEKDQSQNVFELADRVIQWATKAPILLDQINNIWELFIYRDRAQYLSNCKTLLFLLLLAYNKTNFVQYHNQTFQNITLKIKSGLVSCDREAQTTFSSKVKDSHVYNFSFLLCQQVKNNAIQQPGEIFIRIDGGQLNNFALYLPIWRNETTFLIAPLTKFQVSTKGEFLRLKMSLNTQQKMLQRFTQYFLLQKAGLKLFKQQRQMRKLDCFLENMCNGKLQTAGYILNKMVKESPMKNADLVNSYIIFHHLKRNEIEQAYQKLRNDKYYEILSTLIVSCRKGSTVEDAHSLINHDPEHKERSISNDSQSNSAKRSVLDLNKTVTNQFKFMPPKNKRSPSEIIGTSENASKGGKRHPVSIRYKGKGEQVNINGEFKLQEQESQVKIKILPPTPQQTLNQQNLKDSEEDNYASVSSHKNVDKKNINQIFHCSLSRLNSNSSHGEMSQFFQFDDPIIESIDNESPLKRKQSNKREFNFKPSSFVLAQGETEKKREQSEAGTATSTGNFNFLPRKSEQTDCSQDLVEAFGHEEKIDLMQPVLEEELEKHSDHSSEDRQKQTQTDFFKFSLGGSKGLFNIRRKNEHMPRDSIKFVSSNGFTTLQPHLNNIEEESLQINSNQNIHVSTPSLQLLQSSKTQSNKQNEEAKRTSDKKLFTFFKNDQLGSKELGKKPKQPQLHGLSEQSLVFSNDSLVKQNKKYKADPQNKLFAMFGSQKERISEQSSISSIEMQEDAQPVQPQELIQTSIVNQ